MNVILQKLTAPSLYNVGDLSQITLKLSTTTQLSPNVTLVDMFHLPSTICARHVYDRARVALATHVHAATQNDTWCQRSLAHELERLFSYGSERCRDTYVVERQHLPTKASLRAAVTAARAALKASRRRALRCAALSTDTLVVSYEAAESTVAAQRATENAGVFAEQERVLIAIVSSICDDERAKWHCDFSLARALRVRAGLGKMQASGWIYDFAVLPIDSPVQNNVIVL